MEQPAPIFTAIVKAGSDPSDRTVSVLLATDEKQGLQIDLKLTMIAPLMAALASEAASLNSALPDSERMQSSGLNAHAAWLDQSVDSCPTLVFELANGTLLPIVLRGGDLGALADDLARFGLEAASPAH